MSNDNYPEDDNYWASARLTDLLVEDRGVRQPDGFGAEGHRPNVMVEAMLLGLLQVSAEMEDWPEIVRLRELVLREYEERRTHFKPEE